MMSPSRATRWTAAGPIRAWCRRGRQARVVKDIALTTEWVAVTMSGTIVGGNREREFTGVSIDTRTLAPNELFIAIRGERFDGTDFAEAAIDAGAAGVVLPRDCGATLRGAQG